MSVNSVGGVQTSQEVTSVTQLTPPQAPLIDAPSTPTTQAAQQNTNIPGSAQTYWDAGSAIGAATGNAANQQKSASDEAAPTDQAEAPRGQLNAVVDAQVANDPSFVQLIADAGTLRTLLVTLNQKLVSGTINAAELLQLQDALKALKGSLPPASVQPGLQAVSVEALSAPGMVKIVEAALATLDAQKTLPQSSGTPILSTQVANLSQLSTQAASSEKNVDDKKTTLAAAVAELEKNLSEVLPSGAGAVLHPEKMSELVKSYQALHHLEGMNKAYLDQTPQDRSLVTQALQHARTLFEQNSTQLAAHYKDKVTQATKVVNETMSAITQLPSGQTPSAAQIQTLDAAQKALHTLSTEVKVARQLADGPNVPQYGAWVQTGMSAKNYKALADEVQKTLEVAKQAQQLEQRKQVLTTASENLQKALDALKPAPTNTDNGNSTPAPETQAQKDEKLLNASRAFQELRSLQARWANTYGTDNPSFKSAIEVLNKGLSTLQENGVELAAAYKGNVACAADTLRQAIDALNAATKNAGSEGVDPKLYIAVKDAQSALRTATQESYMTYYRLGGTRPSQRPTQAAALSGDWSFALNLHTRGPGAPFVDLHRAADNATDGFSKGEYKLNKEKIKTELTKMADVFKQALTDLAQATTGQVNSEKMFAAEDAARVLRTYLLPHLTSVEVSSLVNVSEIQVALEQALKKTEASGFADLNARIKGMAFDKVFNRPTSAATA